MNNTGRHAFLTAALFFAMLFFTGCFGGTEVGERAFVQLMGLEREDDVYMVSLQIYESESSDAEPDVSKANSSAAYGSGATIHAALSDAEASLGKKLFLGHIKMLVIGSGIKNPADELSLFLDGSVSPSCPMAYSDDPAAVIETLPEEGTFSAEHIMSLMSGEAAHGKTIYTSVAEMAASTGALNCAAALPVISSDGESIRFDGLTFVRKNGTAGTLSEEDTIGAKLLLDMFENGDRITLSITNKGRNASVFITGAKTCLKAGIKDGRLNVNADIRLKTVTAEDPYGIGSALIEQAVCENIRDSCISAFSSAVWYNSCDIFGIKKLVRRDCPEFYGEYCLNESAFLADSLLNVRITVIK
ncbi:MAG: Ger(x)C family spore germination C-terminal domain-containing protein [Oscillospiraceae bacterium]